jgi:hypothetical protein
MTIMSELSPRARELVHSGRGLNRPTPADRERVEAALLARLGAVVSPPETGAASPSGVSPAPRPRWWFVSSALVGVGLIGGALFFAGRHQSGTANAARALAAPVVATSSAAPMVAPTAEASAVVVSTPPPVVSSDPQASSARPGQDRLAQEVALLTHATSDLHAGRAADALKVLDEYQRKFPKGLLTEERRAAKAQALCSLGRRSEAQAELARLAPQSPAAARAKQVCDASSNAGR